MEATNGSGTASGSEKENTCVELRRAQHNALLAYDDGRRDARLNRPYDPADLRRCRRQLFRLGIEVQQ